MENTIKKINVENMLSARGNKEVPNQFIIRTPEGKYFQSYKTIIAFKRYSDDHVFLDQNSWDYSTTTGKYRNDFLGESKPETMKKIKEGIYTLIDLNQ